MALTVIALLCFAALLPFPGLGKHGHSGEHQGEVEQVSINVIVTNKLANKVDLYPITAVQGMPMFGVLNQLQDTNINFNFTYSVSKSYGIFLESVNGLAGSNEKCTYWELLSKRGKTVTRLNVGIGCYQPQRNENFIMNFTTCG